MTQFIVVLIITLVSPIDGGYYKRYLPMMGPYAELKHCDRAAKVTSKANPGYKFVCNRVKIRAKP